jgi:adenylosuccinate synthase
MAVVAVVGAQWGDEGKGHIVDILAARAQTVIRYGGGNNAGHTVVNRHGTFKLHMVPAGIFEPATLNIVGNGTVIDPKHFLGELDGLTARGIAVDNLRISDRAHVIMPYHAMQDRFDEELKGDAKIGTTGRGIGPAYADKMARIGIRVADLRNPELLRERLTAVLAIKNRLLTTYYQAEPLDFETIYREYVAYGQRLAPYIADVYPDVQQALESNQSILLEGAQGVLLDIDHGTYPFVTSSNCVAGNAAAGAGVGPGMLHYILGITKAYCTRVGGGPFPTELDWETPGTPGYHMSTVGAEKGVTTGRSRRCGWFDSALLKRSAQVNGLTGLCITKLDVLDGLTELKLCVGYELDGERIDILPMGADDISRCQPIYETLPGWSESSVGVTQYDLLPANAKRYLQRIQETTGVPIHVVSTSPDRDHTILLHHPFQA